MFCFWLSSFYLSQKQNIAGYKTFKCGPHSHTNCTVVAPLEPANFRVIKKLTRYILIHIECAQCRVAKTKRGTKLFEKKSLSYCALCSIYVRTDPFFGSEMDVQHLLKPYNFLTFNFQGMLIGCGIIINTSHKKWLSHLCNVNCFGTQFSDIYFLGCLFEMMG